MERTTTQNTPGGLGVVGLYVRVSSRAGRDDERFHSPKEQAERARVVALAAGYAPGPVFEDIDVSGATPPDQRPAMGRLLNEIAAHRLAGIAAYSLDRLSREPAHGDTLVKAVTKAGGVILTPDIPDAIDSPTGEFTFGMLLQVAKLYRSQSRARFASAKERAIAAGIPVTNRAAVGYRRNSQRRYEPDPAVAPIIRELFERRATGAGPTELAEFLESHGVTTSQGSATWSKPAIQGLIRSRTYLGEIRSGEFVNTTAHEPIVDEPLWLAAQRPNPAPPRVRKGGYLLAGILRCKACGYCMQGTTTSHGHRIYRCIRRHAGGVCPAPARIRADAVEAHVINEIRGKADIHTPPPTGTPLAALEAEVATAERRLAQVLTDEARDALGDLWAAEVKPRRLARDAALQALGEARASGTEASSFWDAYRDLDVDTASRDELRRAISGLFRYVAVAKDKSIHWPPGDDDPPGGPLPRRGYNRVPGLNPL